MFGKRRGQGALPEVTQKGEDRVRVGTQALPPVLALLPSSLIPALTLPAGSTGGTEHIHFYKYLKEDREL